MPTGTYDANGVYQYGESDPIALFSDFMNLGQESVSDAITNDRARITQVENNMEATSTFVASSAASRDSHWGIPSTGAEQLALQNNGARTVRTDTGYVEQYFGLYNVSTNPGGRTTAGWYTTNRVTGLLPMKPTTVAPAGGTATINDIGTVTVTNCTAVSLNGCFTSPFHEYVVKLDIDGASGSGELRFRLRASGSDNTTNYFNTGYFSAVGAGVTAYSENPGTSSLALFTQNIGISVATWASATIDVFSPQINGWTTIHTNSVGKNASGSSTHVNATSHNSNVFAADGLTLLMTTGSFSGRITVYGYLR